MKMQAFRVREVMVGHSSTAAVVGEDAQGRQIRLEVGALEGASIQPGELLVLNWATVQVPPAELGVTPAQVVLRWENQQGVVVIPRTTRVEIRAARRDAAERTR